MELIPEKKLSRELVDALSSNPIASSVVELSEHPLFRRDYNSLYHGIQEFLPNHLG